MLDGQMAKLSGTASKWGAFLDSSLDRLGDGAVFGGLLLYFAYERQEPVWAGFSLAALVFGQLTSYVRARAESLGFEADGGLAARADRLLIVLAGALLAGLGVPYVLEIAVRSWRWPAWSPWSSAAARSTGRPRRPTPRPRDRLAGPRRPRASTGPAGRAGRLGAAADCCAVRSLSARHVGGPHPRPPPDQPAAQPGRRRRPAGRRSAGGRRAALRTCGR